MALPFRVRRQALLIAVAIFGLVLSYAISGYPMSLRPVGTAAMLYRVIDFGQREKPDYTIFLRAMAGYFQLRDSDQLSNKEVITIIDFRKSANSKRLWVIDLKNKRLLYHSLVAHGKGSGELYASRFSNTMNSHQSSLGFYVTGKTYVGKHGLSLRLLGMEDGINDRAEDRAIVIHGAGYVSDDFIKAYGRLGEVTDVPRCRRKYTNSSSAGWQTEHACLSTTPTRITLRRHGLRCGR